MRKHHHSLRNTRRQLALVVLGFISCIVLLESKGFIVWAKRLEVGSMQQSVLHVAQKTDQVLSTVAEPVTNLRPQLLDYLAQHGWSDIPVNRTNSPEEGSKSEQSSTEENQSDSPREAAQDNTQTTSQIPTSDTPTKGALPQGWLPVIQPSADHKLVPLPALEAGETRRVVLAGDSMMAVGLSVQLQRELSAYKGYISTVKAYRSATGLGRPDVFDWQKEYPLMVGQEKVDVVIVSIGANDTQNFDVNRQILTIGSEQWKEVYAQRLTAYLDMLTKDGAVVLWIKLPPMRPTKYNNNINIVNEVAHAVVTQNPRAIWWDISDRFLNKQGKFQEFAVLKAGQRAVRIRQTDGIHLSDDGAKLISSDIVAWLNPQPKPAPEQKMPTKKQEEQAEASTTNADITSLKNN